MIRTVHSYAKAKVVILDVDNTLYPASVAREQAEIAFCGAVRTQLGSATGALTDQDILEHGYTEYAQCGDPCRLFSTRANSPEHIALHQKFHEEWDPCDIKPDPELAALIKRCRKQGIQFYVYSDAHQAWTPRVLERLGIADQFPPERILTREQVKDFGSKRESFEGFSEICRRAHCEPKDAIMVDDCNNTLLNAKRFGLTTVLSTKPNIPPYHDFEYHNVKEFLSELAIRREVEGRLAGAHSMTASWPSR